MVLINLLGPIFSLLHGKHSETHAAVILIVIFYTCIAPSS